jgi:hypothetical protein
MKATISKKLQNYTLLALTGSLLLPTGCKKDEAEPDNPNVEFIDIEDIVVDATTASVEDYQSLDINKDGINDFEIYAYNASYEGNVYKLTGIYTSEDDSEGDTFNRVASRKVSSPFTEGEFLYFASEVGKGQDVKALTFNDDYAITSANYVYDSKSIVDGLQGKGDKYIAVSFKVGSGSHFGWLKVNVDANATKITIKEVAYNKVPGETLKAGEK